MTSRRRRCTAIDALSCVLQRVLPCIALLLACGVAWCAPVGVVAHLSGPLLDHKADGTTKVLGAQSQVDSGDTLVAEKNTYAQIRFIDNSEITLRPGTTFRIENFAYDAARPQADSAAFSLVKGGLRSITGLLGQRNKEKFSLKTPGATIGIRGTTFVAQWVDTAQPDAPAPGLHVTVLDGTIVVTNGGGTLDVPAGQSGFAAGPGQAPVRAAPHPALQFVPPAGFGERGGGGRAEMGQGGVDCVVR